jgi:CRISPR-associated protein Cas2
MLILSLTDCPTALRGDLTKWLLEINAGVFVGNVSARVRQQLWQRVCSVITSGQATMVYPAQNEQRFAFQTHQSAWEIIDFDGVKLVRRPSTPKITQFADKRLGFSKQSRYRMIKAMHKKRLKRSIESNNNSNVTSSN